MARAVDRGNAVLQGLCDATGANAARVRDTASPAVWWQSPVQVDAVLDASLDNLLEIALDTLPDRGLREGGLLRLCHNAQAPFGLAFSFAGIYVILLIFEEGFNRFQIEPQLRRALPVLEQLVPGLPPTNDAPAGGARVQHLRKPPPR